jgi:hypothetical protein
VRDILAAVGEDDPPSLHDMLHAIYGQSPRGFIAGLLVVRGKGH